MKFVHALTYEKSFLAITHVDLLLSYGSQLNYYVYVHYNYHVIMIKLYFENILSIYSYVEFAPVMGHHY